MKTFAELGFPGRLIAVEGLDGSGKSTCADALTAWLEHNLATVHLHLGRPERSLGTLVAGLRCWDEYESGEGWPWLAPALVLLAIGLALKVVSVFLIGGHYPKAKK